MEVGDNERLLAHLTAEERCEMNSKTKATGGDPEDGINKDQEKELRRRAPRGQSKYQQWREIYKIIFPLDDDAHIPSPC